MAALVDSANASGMSFGVTLGANAHSQLPVDITIAAPSDGSVVNQLKAQWTPTSPWGGNMGVPGATGSYVESISSCVAGQTCTFSVSVPTASMVNGTSDYLSLTVSTSSGLSGGRAVNVAINNPKPSITVDGWPTGAREWAADGPTTLVTRPQPSTAGVPIERVMVFQNPTTFSAAPIATTDAAPFTLAVDPSAIGPIGTQSQYVVVAQDAEGNYSSTWQRVLVAPGADVAPAAVDGANLGSAVNPLPIMFDAEGAIPDSVQFSTAENDPNGYQVSVPAGISSIAISVDGGQPASATWPNWVQGPNAPARGANYYTDWNPPADLSAGVHTVTYTVKTTYGATTTASRTFVIGDGVSFGPVKTSSGKVVVNGSVLPVGQSMLTTTATARTPGTDVISQDAQGDAFFLYGSSALTSAAHQTTMTTGFIPSKVGTYTLWFYAGTVGSGPLNTTTPDSRREISRTVVVEYQTQMKIVGVTRANAKHQRTLTGYLYDYGYHRPLTGMRVTLQKLVNGRWVNVATTTSSSRGYVSYVIGSARSTYRLTTPGRTRYAMAASSSRRTL
jgi:hypothetical protein